MHWSTEEVAVENGCKLSVSRMPTAGERWSWWFFADNDVLECTGTADSRQEAKDQAEKAYKAWLKQWEEHRTCECCGWKWIGNTYVLWVDENFHASVYEKQNSWFWEAGLCTGVASTFLEAIKTAAILARSPLARLPEEPDNSE